MNEELVDYAALRKKAQDAKTFAIVSLCLKASVIMMGIVSKMALLMLILLAYFAYIAFAIIAMVYAIPLLETSKKLQDSALAQEINNKATFALISSIIIIVLLFVK